MANALVNPPVVEWRSHDFVETHHSRFCSSASNCSGLSPS